MKLKSFFCFIFLVAFGGVILGTVSGCAKLMGSLRRDLDDTVLYEPSPPTVGGRWSERELLSDDRGPERPSFVSRGAVGHVDRSPASISMSEEDSTEEVQRPPVLAQEYLQQKPFKNGPRATQADFVDDSTQEGSLWASSGQTNYYFSKNKVRGIGDIVTINIEQEMLRDIQSEVARTLAPREKEIELATAQERIRAKTLGLEDPTLKKEGGVAAARAPAGAKGASASSINEDEINIPKATTQDIDVSPFVEIKAGDTMLSEILERYPNGNYKVRATKKIQYRKTPRLLTLMGIVKSTDISEEDVLNSGRIYEYRLEVLHP